MDDKQYQDKENILQEYEAMCHEILHKLLGVLDRAQKKVDQAKYQEMLKKAGGR